MDQNRRCIQHLIFNKGAQKYNGEKTSSSTSAAGKTGYPHVED
jgi:hypothetical protein